MTEYVTPDRVVADRAELYAASTPPEGQRWAVLYDFPTGERTGAKLVPIVSPSERLADLFAILREVFRQMVINGAGAEALLVRIRELETNLQLPLLDEPGALFPDGDTPATSEMQAVLHEMYRRHEAAELPGWPTPHHLHPPEQL